MELLDILDEMGAKTGKTEDYYKVHELGLWHRSVHIWLLNPKGELLLQKRSATRQAYPGYWDISAAGHISAGQTSLETAVRETREELGVSLPEGSFEYLFSLEENEVLNNGAYINREFQDVYLVHLASDALKTPSSEEVEDMRWVAVDELKKMVQEGLERIVPHTQEYDRLFKVLGL